MAKILFIYRVVLDEPSNEGIKKKLIGQLEAFKHHGLQADCIYLSVNGLMFNESIYAARSLVNKKKLFTYYLSKYYFDALAIIQEVRPDYLYIRHFVKTNKTKKFFKLIKQTLPKSKLILEIPTYPYRDEYKGLLKKTLVNVDAKISNRLFNVIDFVVHYGAEETIWDIPTIRIQNGVAIRKPRKDFLKLSNEIVFVAVGKLWEWWGLDLFIEAMDGYRRKSNSKKIKLKIVGEGKELKKLRSLVKRMGLEKQVAFLGHLGGRKYEDEIQSAHIGIGTLAIHRKGVKYSSSLKHREYASYGLPFLYQGLDKDFENLEWALRISTAERLKLSKILDWISSLKFQAELFQEIQAYASENLTWKIKVLPIINRLNLLK